MYLGSSFLNGENLKAQPDDPLCLGDEYYPRRLKVTLAPSVG
jgi:hypothetical protein